MIIVHSPAVMSSSGVAYRFKKKFKYYPTFMFMGKG
jgi:hypothetical protein